ncbi:hypothetical protein DLM78_07670 [Leptospira stimsonii]|uniref:Uncharacterized protein n=1 Tax=Leptospira stimsonii TaxID=2202203 RepID=A0A8B3CU45_9LEPT|nr:hypothetical protein DLM78_07670 [Leptospira stimsonii]
MINTKVRIKSFAFQSRWDRKRREIKNRIQTNIPYLSKARRPKFDGTETGNDDILKKQTIVKRKFGDLIFLISVK